MDLDEQIQLLVDNAPQDGRTPGAIRAIAPVLKLVASQLRHEQYFILQSLTQGWVLTTLSNRANPNVEKRVIYAFPTIKDVPLGSSELDPQIIAVPILVTHLLFQLVALPDVDSVVFMETPGNLAAGSEVRREDVQNLIQTQLQQYKSAPSDRSPNLPPDLA